MGRDPITPIFSESPDRAGHILVRDTHETTCDLLWGQEQDRGDDLVDLLSELDEQSSACFIIERFVFVWTKDGRRQPELSKGIILTTRE
jgi:hypothetical protein